eukprot:767793-Hanusia_phi.AAC.1
MATKWMRIAVFAALLAPTAAFSPFLPSSCSLRRPSCAMSLRMQRGRPASQGRDKDRDPRGKQSPGGRKESGVKEAGSSKEGRKLINSMIKEVKVVETVGKKMQDFDLKKMPQGTKFLGSFDGEPPLLAVPEVAFAGRSNVGKSSMLNCLTGTKLAVTSKTPGRTRRINLFAHKDSNGRALGIVDLPGLGYAKMSKDTKEKLSNEITQYIKTRESLKLLVILVDPRLEPQEQDVLLAEMCLDSKVPFIMVGTKADKLSNNEIELAFSKYETAVGISTGQLIAFSSKTGEGKAFVWKQIIRALFSNEGKEEDEDEDEDDDGEDEDE